MKDLHRIPALVLTAALLCLSLASCSRDEAKAAALDPARCSLRELGEATTAMESGKLPTDQLVHMEGITHPGTLVWKDAKSGAVNYVTRVMGTGQKLFYMQQIENGEEPGILSDFQGTLLRWTDMPREESAPMARALKDEWKVDVIPEGTYILKGGTKPLGCP